MAYVMVPVPDELVPDVKHFIRWNLTGPSADQLDHDGAARFFESLDEEAQRFLLVVADAAVESHVLSVRDAAAATGCSEREALGLMAELNTSVQYFGAFPFGLVMRESVEESGGSDSEPSYTFTMAPAAAALVLAASGRGVLEH